MDLFLVLVIEFSVIAHKKIKKKKTCCKHVNISTRQVLL